MMELNLLESLVVGASGAVAAKEGAKHTLNAVCESMGRDISLVIKDVAHNLIKVEEYKPSKPDKLSELKEEGKITAYILLTAAGAYTAYAGIYHLVGNVIQMLK